MVETKGQVSLTCKTCGTAFVVSRYDAEVRGRSYCSIECRAAKQKIPIPEKDHLTSLYGAGMSIVQLAAHYGVSKGTVSGWFRSHEIEARPPVHGLRNVAGRRRPRSKHGKRAVLGGLYVRSSWECNYGLILNHAMEEGLVLRWEYEPDTFDFPVKRGSRFYTPDFKVFLLDDTFEYHEVKAHMDQPSATKLKRMAKYYPDIRVRLVDKVVYKQMEKQFSKVLDGWES